MKNCQRILIAKNMSPILLGRLEGLSLFAKFHSQKEVDDYIDAEMGSLIL